MTIQNLPFTISKRKDSKYFSVRFKDKVTGEYLPAVSTKQTDKDSAIQTALQWYATGTVKRQDKTETLEKRSIFAYLKNNDVSDTELEKIIDLLKQQGKLKLAVIAGTKQDIDIIQYLLDFWTWEKSEYVQEKLRREKRITKYYVKNSYSYIVNYWKPFFTEKLLGEVTRQDIKNFMNDLNSHPLSASSKNKIWLAGAIAIRYAYNNELLEHDVTRGITGFYGKSSEREILTPELAQALFSVAWENDKAYLANLLAMCTGLRAGEVAALRKKDIGEHCLYINHSWNDVDGLKCPKNGEARIVQLPFPNITEKLLELANTNCFNTDMDAFIFYANVPNRPMERQIFTKELRKALQSIGLTAANAKKYSFHGWRHFYTAYMHDYVSAKQLQSQTGHKTRIMLEHYAHHEINGDIERVQSAQKLLFGNIVDGATISIDTKRLYKNIQTGLVDKSGMYEHSRQDR